MTEPFTIALRGELLGAATRQRHRRAARRRARVVAASCVAAGVVLAIALAAIRPGRASAGVDISLRAGQLEVRLTDLESRPDVIREALHDAGLDARVDAAPVGPSLVGRFVNDISSVPPEMQALDAHDGSFDGFVLPAGWRGQLVLRVGRPAAAGELYARPSNAFADGEPLACRGLAGTRVDQLAARLPAALRVRVQVFTGPTTVGPLRPLAEASAADGAARIASAEAFSPTDVVVLATVDGRPGPGMEPPADARC